MPDPASSLPADYFDDIYRAERDPWRFETSPYEAAKYAATLTALPRERYRSAFEIGCSIGVLTARLAERCDRLLSVDLSELALDEARRRTAMQPQVELRQMAVPTGYPDERFDLTLLSEVGYYWSTADLRLAGERIIEHLESGGHLLLVHWTEPVPDYPHTGDEVHEHFLTAYPDQLRHLDGRREPQYRLDLWERR